MWRQAEAISERVQALLKSGGKDRNLDLEIEGLVAGLYGLNRSDLVWVKEVICDAQDLEPMRALGDFDSCSIQPKIAS